MVVSFGLLPFLHHFCFFFTLQFRSLNNRHLEGREEANDSTYRRIEWSTHILIVMHAFYNNRNHVWTTRFFSPARWEKRISNKFYYLYHFYLFPIFLMILLIFLCDFLYVIVI